MMTIFIDTNIIVTENYFRSPLSQAFCKACSFLGIDVVIPEIVYDETLGNYPKNLRRKLKEFEKAQRELAKLVSFELSEVVLKDSIEQYEEWFDKLIDKYGLVLSPYPDLPLKTLVKENYSGQKPFKETGEGYKDYIVWQTIRQHIESESKNSKNVFVTNNSKDFFVEYEDETFALHPTLAEQVEDRSLRPEVFKSLKKTFDEIIAPQFDGASPDDIPDLSRSDIEAITAEHLLQKLPYRTLYGLEGVPFSNDVTIDMVDEPSIEDIQLIKLADEIIIKVSGTVGLEVSGFLDRHEFYHEETPDVSVHDANWNEYVMAVGTNVETEFEHSIYYSIEDHQISASEVALPQEIDPDWY